MRRKILSLIMIMASFLFVGKVYAEEKEEDYCSATLLSELRTEAANVKVTYVTGDEMVDNGYDPEVGITKIKKHYVYIKIFNINSKMMVRVTPSGKGVSGTEQMVGINNVNPDGVITFRQEALDANVTYQFDVISVYGGCSGTSLRSMKLTIPKFNIYSELDICSDVPDYYLCLQYTNYNIDSATVYDRINDYKATLAKQNVDEENSKDNNTVKKAISSISKYKYVIVGAVVAIGVIITVIIVKRKKSEL